jgi:glucosamine--fructose-6-phosphate aminotransferase (isomerizing)
MKHGPLALVVPGVVAVFSCTDSSIVDKIVSNMKEVQARGGTVVCVTSDVTGIVKRAADITIEIPATKHEFLNALLAVIPLQMLAYHVAKLRGCDIDQPRNLAKSVTVE